MKPAAAIKGAQPVLPPDTIEALSSAAGAAGMLGAGKAQGLLELTDGDLGRLMKAGITQMLRFSAQLTFDLPRHRNRTSVRGKRAGAANADLVDSGLLAAA